MDEIFEAATLIQAAKISRFPLVLIVSKFWRPLLEFLLQHLVKEKTTVPADVNGLIVTDSNREAVALITEVTVRFVLRRAHQAQEAPGGNGIVLKLRCHRALEDDD